MCGFFDPFWKKKFTIIRGTFIRGTEVALFNMILFCNDVTRAHIWARAPVLKSRALKFKNALEILGARAQQMNDQHTITKFFCMQIWIIFEILGFKRELSTARSNAKRR